MDIESLSISDATPEVVNEDKASQTSSKRPDYISWDSYFMATAFLVKFLF